MDGIGVALAVVGALSITAAVMWSFVLWRMFVSFGASTG